MIEVPIFTRRCGLFELVYEKLRVRPNRRPSGCVGAPASAAIRPGFAARATALMRRLYHRRRMMEFSLLSSEQLKHMVWEAYRRYESYELAPVVAIGHPKAFGAPEELDVFLSWAEKQHGVSLDPISESSFWRGIG